jgi:hypothetical protein
MTTWFWPWRVRRGSESTQTAKSKPAITGREATGYPLVHHQEGFWVMSCSGAYEELAERNHKVFFGNAHKARLSIAQKVS